MLRFKEFYVVEYPPKSTHSSTQNNRPIEFKQRAFKLTKYINFKLKKKKKKKNL